MAGLTPTRLNAAGRVPRRRAFEKNSPRSVPTTEFTVVAFLSVSGSQKRSTITAGVSHRIVQNARRAPS